MAEALAGVILKKLGSLAADQASLLWGLKSEIPKLERTVSAIRAVLLDAEEQSNHRHLVKQWLWELKQVLYDAEDLLDDLSAESLLRDQMDGNFIVNEVRTFFSPSNQVVYGLKIANEIKDIQNKLDNIYENMKKFNFQPRPVDSMSNNNGWRQTHSSIPDVVIGREADKQKIIDMLLLSCYKEKVAVIPILGMGGLVVWLMASNELFLLTMSNSDFQTEEYEVFLSFRGSDVRQSFADHLYACLVRSKIRTFRDEEVLQKGETIGPSLVKAITESKILIPIFTQNYASSKWCLQELAKMVDCYKNGGSGSSNGQQIILPVFYFMDARAVRHPDSGPYKEAFDRHSLKHDPETVLEWKEALQEIGKMKGWHVTGSDGSLEERTPKNLNEAGNEPFLQHKFSVVHLTSKVVITELRVPTEWEIQVNRDRNGILGLTEGLTDFFDFYSIANGYLLMFGYVGTSTINAALFGNDEFEIAYPIRDVANGQDEDRSDLDTE
ncbi:Disease resistance protein L6 [Linum perenne]